MKSAFPGGWRMKRIWREEGTVELGVRGRSGWSRCVQGFGKTRIPSKFQRWLFRKAKMGAMPFMKYRTYWIHRFPESERGGGDSEFFIFQRWYFLHLIHLKLPLLRFGGHLSTFRILCFQNGWEGDGGRSGHGWFPPFLPNGIFARKYPLLTCDSDLSNSLFLS